MKKQQGFTLIELIVVIVILGILAATAVPRFANMQADAREATLNGIKGAVASASSIYHAKHLVDGTNPASITLENVVIVGSLGYPNAATIGMAAGFTNTPANAAGRTQDGITLTLTAAPSANDSAKATFTSGNCSFIYTEASKNNPVPTIGNVTGGTC